MAFIASACKSKKKNTAFKRAYHNVTAHYNGYFNAKMRVDNVAKQSEAAFTDNYDNLLPVFKFKQDEAGAKTPANNQPLDEAIKKASLVVQRHEVSDWIDDTYIIIGRAYFYKKDYFTAIESFQYVAGLNQKKSKPKPSKGKTQFLGGKRKDREVGSEAYVWMIKSYLQLKKLPPAESVINIALASSNFSKDHISELFASTAAFYIEKKNYVKAIEYLEKAVKVERKKAKKTRYTFILAQLHELTGDPNKSSVYFRKVVAMNPAYEMAFNAKINSARLFQSNSLSGRKTVEKELLAMLKDDKNKEFRDQVYFALANIYENSGQESKAIEFYKNSAGSSIRNNAQKGRSFLKLATIYYDTPDYENAQVFYDSAATFLPTDHPQFANVNLRKNSLTKLVNNLRIIKREDSLQALSKMSEKELLASIDRIIAKEEEVERRRKEQEELARKSVNMATQSDVNNNAGASTNTTAGTSWYFYNTSAIGIGFNDFIKKFGRRSLEDNWRRANKESFASVFGEQTDSIEVDVDAKNPTEVKDAKRKKYLKNIPRTAEELEASDAKIVQAYYNIGTFYKEELVNTKESVKNFEALLKRFPENRLRIETYFNLYRLYTQLNNQKQADYYKNKILNDHPNSLFAKVISDPSFTSDALELDKRAQKYYDSVYTQYTSGDFASVLSHKAFIDSTYSTTSIGPKYSYLYALSVSKTNGIPEMEMALNNLIKNYPSSDAASSGRVLLQKIAEMRDPTLQTSKETTLYKKESKATYYFMLTSDAKVIQRETRTELARMIDQQFSIDKPSITTELIGTTHQAIIVKSFPDLGKAAEFLDAVNKQAAQIIKMPKGSYSLSFISEKNLALLLVNKDVEKYLQFYLSNYKGND